MRLIPFTSRLRRGEEPTLSGLPSLRSEMDRIFDRMLRSPWMDEPGTPAAWLPSVDVSETESEIVLRAEVPGINPDQIEISVSGDRLIIAGEKSEEHEEKDEHYYHCERRFGAFERSIELPSTADLEKVTADHSNGVLTIHVPKLETAKPRRVQIESKQPSSEKRKKVSVTERSGNSAKS